MCVVSAIIIIAFFFNSLILQRESVQMQRESLAVERERLLIKKERFNIERRRLEQEEERRVRSSPCYGYTNQSSSEYELYSSAFMTILITSTLFMMYVSV
ncbi:hypothetical protein MHBO_003651 [Bonamia ostreae]|uniref:Uncharacterized protein n=1 Tax=Bonamia ostreae TaxID=126728 RepID=A0ABV2AR67_9EUKA